MVLEKNTFKVYDILKQRGFYAGLSYERILNPKHKDYSFSIGGSVLYGYKFLSFDNPKDIPIGYYLKEFLIKTHSYFVSSSFQSQKKINNKVKLFYKLTALTGVESLFQINEIRLSTNSPPIETHQSWGILKLERNNFAFKAQAEIGVTHDWNKSNTIFVSIGILYLSNTTRIVSLPRQIIDPFIKISFLL